RIPRAVVDEEVLDARGLFPRGRRRTRRAPSPAAGAVVLGGILAAGRHQAEDRESRDVQEKPGRDPTGPARILKLDHENSLVTLGSDDGRETGRGSAGAVVREGWGGFGLAETRLGLEVELAALIGRVPGEVGLF